MFEELYIYLLIWTSADLLNTHTGKYKCLLFQSENHNNRESYMDLLYTA